MVERDSGCRAEVSQAAQERSESVLLSSGVRKMKESGNPYYELEAERMVLFVETDEGRLGGEIDSRLVAAFEAAFAQSCFLCPEGDIWTGVKEAVEEARRVVDESLGRKSELVEGHSAVEKWGRMTIKLRVLQLLDELGVSGGKAGRLEWDDLGRNQTLRSEDDFTAYKASVIRKYNQIRFKLLLKAFGDS
jgi:hypothetical protein